jgi:hypothetical protein
MSLAVASWPQVDVNVYTWLVAPVNDCAVSLVLAEQAESGVNCIALAQLSLAGCAYKDDVKTKLINKKQKRLFKVGFITNYRILKDDLKVY